LANAEFTVSGAYRYNRSGPARWIISHVRRYPIYLLGTLATTVVANWMASRAQVEIGRAFDHVASPGRSLGTLLAITLGVLGFGLGAALLGLLGNVLNEFLAQRLERDARDELYLSLLGKSLTFHGRQRLGDVMARATNDVRQLNLMFSPGLRLIISSGLSLVIPIAVIGGINPRLLLVPLLFVPALVLTVWHYNRELAPVAEAQQVQFGAINARLAEAISGIEVVKANAQEPREQEHFLADAAHYRDLSVRQGEIQARYLPLLAYYVMFALGFVHVLLLYRQGQVTVGDIVAFLGLLGLLQFPTFISIFTFSLVQLGLAGARRILELIEARTELDENKEGVAKPIVGDVVFEDVSFSYDDTPVLHHIRFHARPGETIAIVGQTGSGKTTLTRLINRIYDATEGRVLVDGIDVRDWSIEALRSQISTIEQDIFLFSRSIAENIAFGAPRELSREEIERYAREAQAHDFIMALPDGYETIVGERGATLSGGQRQRIAIARAFATDPRILILDDSTSAIDSATEDQIQAAMSRVSQGRTTFLITHRLSQIRWADRILVLRQGRLEDQGTHEELLARSQPYRNIFARYEAPRPAQAGQAENPSGDVAGGDQDQRNGDEGAPGRSEGAARPMGRRQ
jgi:ATP-binding cassette subfamily B protein